MATIRNRNHNHQRGGKHTHQDPFLVTRPKHEIHNQTVGKVGGTLNRGVDSITNTDVFNTIATGHLGTTWRGLILLNRAGLDVTSYASIGIKKTKDIARQGIDKGLGWIKGKMPGPGNRTINFRRSGSTSFGETSALSFNSELKSQDKGFKGAFTSFSRDEDFKPDDVLPFESEDNKVIIFNPLISDPDNGGNPMGVILQNRPSELDYQPQSNWADIKSFGRNVPMYHYMGSETTLQFTTSWYMPNKPGDKDFNLYWVINQCRTLESWSMANGYIAAPPYLYIQWGESDLFDNCLWILHSATYKLHDFHDRLLIRDTPEMGDDWVQGTKMAYSKKPKEYALINQGLVPFSATQELIFKRVSGINLWYSDIRPPKKSLITDYQKQLFTPPPVKE